MYDFLIIGGGIIGLLTARELAANGENVAIVDRQQPGQESSWAAGGILSPLFPWEYPEAINRLNERSQLLYPDLVASLKQQTGIDPELVPSGMLLTSQEHLQEASKWYEQHNVPFKRLNAQQLQHQFPHLLALNNTGLLLEHIGHIRPPALMQALLQSLQENGVDVLDHHCVDHIDISGDFAKAICLKNGKRLKAEHYILCSGAWSQQLWPETGSSIDIQPVKGQMLLYPDCGIQLNCMYMHDHRYLIQRKDGRILVGSSIEHSGFDDSISSQVRHDLTAFAESCCPSLQNISIEKHWSGLRPAAPNSMPYIDKHHRISNLSINSGHFRNGIVLAPASAEMTANQLLNRQQSVDPHPFSIATQ